MLSPSALKLLDMAEKIFCLDAELLKVFFQKEKDVVDKTVYPLKPHYKYFLPTPDDGCLSVVHKDSGVSLEDVYEIAKTKINPKTGASSPKGVGSFNVKVVYDINSRNGFDLNVTRDNINYDYHTSIGIYPSDDGECKAIAMQMRISANYIKFAVNNSTSTTHPES